ncbi:MAG TPA: glycosyltransferase family 4 protein [Anaerohalosphaeraceae bacterium]|nr:glycosyltransferase family 4 protein [Anaerohalosphaeraceae bacterium]HRV20432.1 glycosyltransferase family 4 protein [Anaerohalosphaeraceae bacterium]
MTFEVCAGSNSNIGGGKRLACVVKPEQAEGIRWCLLRSYRLGRWEWQPGAVWKMLKESPDAVICHGFFCLSNWIVRLICKLRRIPVLDWTQGVKRPEKGIRWWLADLYYRQADAILFYGNFARDYFIKKGYPAKKLFVVYNSLDYDTQKLVLESITPEAAARCRIEFGVVNPEDRLIINSSRLERGKQIDLLIRAVAMLKQMGHRVYAVLVGDGQERSALETLARELSVADRVRFFGACYQEDKLGLLFAAADVCVMPGPVGLIAMHCLVYGTPLLTCENSQGRHGPEIETIVEGKTGRFFRQGDAADLAEKMKQMLYPIPCKEHMSAACMDIIDRYYTPQYQEKVILEALNSVLPKDKQIINS